MDEATPVPPAGAQQARLRTDVIVTFGGKAATLLLALATAAIVARELGPSGQAVFAVAFTLTLVLVQVGGLGFTTANPYFVAREPALLPRVVGNAVWFSALLGLVLIAAGVVLKLVAPSAIEGLGWEPLLVTLAGIPGALAVVSLQSILLGQGRMVGYSAIEAGQNAVTLIAVLVAFEVFGSGLTGALAAIGVVRYGAAVAALVLLRRSLELQALDFELWRRMLGYGARIYVAILVSFLVIRVDLFLVNTIVGREEAGVYSIAAALADGMFVLPMVIGLNLLPRVARGDPTQASAEVFRSIAVLYGLFCLVTVPLAGPAISIIFGESYEGATSLYYWLLPGIFALGMLTILSHHFAGRGYPPQAVAFWVFALVLNVVLNLIFLPGRGAEVAAILSSVTYIILLAMHMGLFAREAGGYGSMRPRLREVVRFVRVALSRG